jgi:DNA-3-methyladenine glycosylase I
MTQLVTRCTWANSDPLLTEYHDTEWGVITHDDQKLFEMLNLEGAQAGLSWLTILKKREGYRQAFDNFDASKIAAYTEAKRAELLANPAIIRNRLKVNAFIENAKAYLETQRVFSSFDAYIWSFTSGPLTPEQGDTVSKAMSKDMKKRGFRFVGPTTCYAFMQVIGMVNDHDATCFRRVS